VCAERQSAQPDAFVHADRLSGFALGSVNLSQLENKIRGSGNSSFTIDMPHLMASKR
jgi:hypothetical protein